VAGFLLLAAAGMKKIEKEARSNCHSESRVFCISRLEESLRVGFVSGSRTFSDPSLREA
jgi:hypothetical protein